MRMPVVPGLGLVLLFLCSGESGAEEVDTRVDRAVTAAGGREKLFERFRMRERLNVSSNPEGAGKERVSVLEPPMHWWLGTKDRVKESNEPATFLVWAWTLGAITDPKSKIEVLPDVTEADRPAFGLRVGESIDPPMDLYFDRTDGRLVRIDWRADIHRFSEWKEFDGATYPTKCVGYRKSTGKPWYFTEVLELTRLEELPDDLKR